MCGVVAIWNAQVAVPEVHSELAAGLSQLAHRGPDGVGHWVAHDGRVGLAHSRLAIVDIEAGRQPLRSEDAQVQAVVNGEFYGWEKIRDELESRGHIFRTQCDSEVLVHLYLVHGVECLQQLRGEFSFVLWDARQGRLLAARDRFGVKPLVYARGERGQLLIASEAKALFSMGLAPRWNRSAFHEVASHQYLSPAQSLFAGVSMLQPGHLLIAEGDSWHTHCYWSLAYPGEDATPDKCSDAEHAVEIRRLLDESVRLRLQGDSRVACYLSAGIDSSAMAALAVRHSEHPVTCFGIAFDDPAYDEHRRAADFASALGARFEAVPVTSDEIVTALPQAVRFSEGLCINGQLSAKFLLSKAVRAAGFRSVLVGEGADELFCGYQHLQRDYDLYQSRRGDVAAGLRLARAAEGIQSGIMFPTDSQRPTLDCPELETIPTALIAKLATGHRMRRFLRDDFLAEGPVVSPALALVRDASILPELDGRHPVDQAAVLWIRTALASYILKTLGDGTEMAHSIEGRVPFLDHKLFERAREIPPSSKLKAGVAKSILRRALSDLLPPDLLSRPKHPLLAPPIAGRRGTPGWAMALDVVHSRQFQEQPFWDAPRLGAWMQGLHQCSEATRREADPVVMLALSTHALQQAFGLDGAGCA